MDLLEQDQPIERTLRTINQCFAFQIPPQTSASGHRAENWPQNPAWIGMLVISICGDTLFLRLKDSNSGTGSPK